MPHKNLSINESLITLSHSNITQYLSIRNILINEESKFGCFVIQH